MSDVPRDMSRRQVLQAGLGLADGSLSASPLAAANRAGQGESSPSEAPRHTQPDPDPAARLRSLDPPRPRLHFDGEQLDALRKQADSTHRAYATRLHEAVERHRDWSPPVDVPDPRINELMLGPVPRWSPTRPCRG